MNLLKLINCLYIDLRNLQLFMQNRYTFCIFQVNYSQIYIEIYSTYHYLLNFF